MLQEFGVCRCERRSSASGWSSHAPSGQRYRVRPGAAYSARQSL